MSEQHRLTNNEYNRSDVLTLNRATYYFKYVHLFEVKQEKCIRKG